MNRRGLFIFSFNNIIAKVICLVVVLMLIFWCLVVPQYSYDYNGSIIDKTSRLVSINDPKIILVGNSNVAFGFRSDIIEEAIGMKVVNLGIHGALGDEFQENIAKLNINPGDIIIECPISFGGAYTEMQDHTLVWTTIENHLKLWKLVPLHEWYDMILAYPRYVKKSIRLLIEGIGNRADDGPYSRTAFNEYGDNIYVDEHPEIFEFPNDYAVEIPEIHDEYIYRLNKFNDYVEKRGAKLYVAGYPIACENPSLFYDEFSNLKDEVENRLSCEIISDYCDYMYPYDYFYNTEYHLTREGAEIRTKQLIKDLVPFLN